MEKMKNIEKEVMKELHQIEDSDTWRVDEPTAIATIKLTQQKTAQHYLDEKEWLEFREVENVNPKGITKKFIVWSKCSDTRLGEIKWYPSWRAYCFIIDMDKIELFTKLLMFSDRCQLQMGYFTKKLNDEHKKGVK